MESAMEPLAFTGGAVFSDRGRLYTASVQPGRRVYGERLYARDGVEYREWDPRRSKLSAYLALGGRQFPFSRDSRVLYLGASTGTTPSHVSDICRDGRVFCVEFAPRVFRELVANCEGRPNMMPILGDATKPSEYSVFVDGADVVYQDVAQKRQADILCDNMEAFGVRKGMLALKARSEDVTARPEEIFRAAERTLQDRGMRVVDSLSLEQYEKSHMMFVVEMVRCPPPTPWRSPMGGSSWSATPAGAAGRCPAGTWRRERPRSRRPPGSSWRSPVTP